ncbi:hypothetical protein BD311DRAFT_787978 [Dichomitus squalens]|uniref:Ribosome assembly protein 3 n=1 Tax=Dichomitus squalens TaxID=114155 RepID=A0A4Q9MN51_9APHY|nr:hypothetical protein BD311DRAFT_787978 [Dichomitus squalens]
MAPAPAKPPAARKRMRKRKRRAVSSSESSSSDDSSSDSEAPQQAVIRVSVKGTKKPEPEPSDPSSSSSDSDTEDDSDVEPAPELSPEGVSEAAPQKPARRSLSPTPPPSSIHPFLPPKSAAEDRQDEQVLKERFRKFWMASVADAFKDDLEEIRKEPNLTASRLAMLIDSLAGGGDVFTSSRVGPDSSMTEMEIVLEHNT